jgi:hypothetical protein
VVSEFLHQSPQPKTISAKWAAMTPEQKEKQRMRTAAWRNENREALNARRRATPLSGEQREKKRQKDARYRDCNRPKLREKYAAQSAASYRKHREKRLAWTAAYYAAHPEKKREPQRQRRYGVDPVVFAALLAAQRDRCAICRRPFTATPQIDHDHQTGLVRGLLDAGCNGAIGHLGDSADLVSGFSTLAPDEIKHFPRHVRAAWFYLRKYQAWRAAVEYLGGAEK